MPTYSADFLGAACQLVAYGIISPAGPFPVMCCAFFLIGFGLSIQNAHANGFVASLNSSAKMGFLHSSYGTFPNDAAQAVA